MNKKIIIPIVLVTLFLAMNALSKPTTISFSDGRPDKTLNSVVIDGYRYYQLNDIAIMLRAAKLWYPDSKKIVLKFDGHRIKLALDNSIVIIDKSRLSKLVHPVIDRDGQIFVSSDFLENVLAKVIPIEVDGEPVEEVRIKSKDKNITGVDFAVNSNETICKINTTEDLRYEIDVSKKSRLIVTIHRGKVDAGDINTDTPHGLVKSIRAYQTDKLVQISFELSPDVARTYAEKQQEPSAIVVHIEADPDKRTSSIDHNHYQMDEEFDVIVIDPGHGGKDPGAVGATGLYEKDMTLGISKKLKKVIEANTDDIEVILTRYDDTFIGLRRRTEIANNAKADLFISIHCNASPSRNARGSETYFLALANNNQARAVEARENKVIEFEIPDQGPPPSDILELILWDMAQNEFHLESSQLAEKIQDALNKNLGIKSRGINQAGFHVLKGAFMPAILVETAFISNPREEQLLKTDSFQQEIAQGIYQGIKVFINLYSKK